MATKVLNNYYLLLNSVNLSAYVRNLSLKLANETGDDTAGANITAREYAPTIKTGNLTVTFNLELGAGAVEATLWAIYNGNAAVAFSCAVDGSTASASNPVYSGSVILTDFPPFEGEVGTKGEVTVQLPTTGAVTRAIA